MYALSIVNSDDKKDGQVVIGSTGSDDVSDRSRVSESLSSPKTATWFGTFSVMVGMPPLRERYLVGDKRYIA